MPAAAARPGGSHGTGPWPLIHYAGEDDILLAPARWHRTLDDFEVILNLGRGATFETAGARWALSPGDALVLRPGEPHTLAFDGVHRVRWLFCHHSWHGLPQAVGLAGPDPWRWPVYLPAGPHAPHLAKCLQDMLAALWARRGPWQWQAAVGLLSAAAVFEDAAAEAPLPPPAGGHLQSEAVRLACAFLEQHLADSSAALVRSAARAAGISVSQLNRLFHRACGMSPRHWVNGLRLSRASVALVHHQADIAAAAHAAGIADVHYFSRFFRTHMGLTPTAYRQQFAGRWGASYTPRRAARPDTPALQRRYPCNVHLSGT